MIVGDKQMTGYTDERKKSKRRRARTELIKTVIIVLLFLSMVTLASVEIVQTQRLSNIPAEDIDIESLLVLHDDRASGTIAPYILPEFLGYSIGGVSRGLFGGETTMRGLYGLLYGVMTELLTAGVCKTLPADEGEAVWDAAREGDFVYICYFEELPASAIAYAVSDGGTELAEGDVPYIRELFIRLADPGQNSPCCIVTRSEDGRVSVYSHKPGKIAPDFDQSLLTAYNNSRQLAQFSFLGDFEAKTDVSRDKIGESGAEKDGNTVSGETAADISTVTAASGGEEPEYAGDENAAEGLARFYRLRDTTVLIGGEFTQKYIIAETGASLSKRIGDSGAEEKLLELLGINTDRVAPYHSKGYTIYLGESGRVRISDTGGIDYTAVSSAGSTGGGVPVSSFLGYERYGGRYTYFELLTAAASLLESISEISPDLLGGEAVPGLISVSAGEAGLKMVFGYFYDNYRIIGLGPAVTLAFADGMLTELALTPASITKSGLCVSLPQEWAIKHLYDLALAADKPAVPAGSELTIAYNAAVAVRADTGEPDTTAPETNGADTVQQGEAQPGDTAAPQSTAETQSEEEAGTDPDGVQDDRIPAEIPIAPDWVILAAQTAVLGAPEI
jgi:hypothetical protein